MAIHERATDRLLGTCAFSQLDGENGSALFHITIGEKDAWNQGFGTEATRLMLEHAFERLRLHRIGLSVFAFNERAIRAYQRAGFVIEGRAREAIRRDDRWWDEVEMSILQGDWQAQRASRDGQAGDRPDDPARGGRREPAPDRSGHRPPARHADDRADPLSVASSGPAADAARADFRAAMEAKGHAVDNARAAADGLEAAFASGALQRTPLLDQMLGDLGRRPGAGRRPEARRQERRGRPVHPPGDLARARQRLRVIAYSPGRASRGRPGTGSTRARPA